MKIQLSHSRGFTLMELLIVITIIGILMMMSLFPFASYMDRSALRQAKDELTQEWILAHKAVRNGIQFEKDNPNTSEANDGRHASILFAFEPKSSTIEISLLADGDPNKRNDVDNKKPYKTITLERKIEVLSFSNVSDPSKTLHYIISPPYATGEFYEGITPLSEENTVITLGYPGSNATSGRQKQLYLRPYLH